MIRESINENRAEVIVAGIGLPLGFITAFTNNSTLENFLISSAVYTAISVGGGYYISGKSGAFVVGVLGGSAYITGRFFGELLRVHI
ncbi:MAG: hypothetical protein ABIJ18_01625 [archaeon]